MWDDFEIIKDNIQQTSFLVKLHLRADAGADPGLSAAGHIRLKDLQAGRQLRHT